MLRRGDVMLCRGLAMAFLKSVLSSSRSAVGISSSLSRSEEVTEDMVVRLWFAYLDE